MSCQGCNLYVSEQIKYGNYYRNDEKYPQYLCQPVTSIGIVNGLQDGRPGFDSWQGKGHFSLRHSVQTGPEAHPTSYPMATGGSFPGGKAVEA
jgi:hypothetical protein